MTNTWRAPRLGVCGETASGNRSVTIFARSGRRVCSRRSFPPRRVRRRARVDNDARGEALARVVSRAERRPSSRRARFGRPVHLRVETRRGTYASPGRVCQLSLARTPRRLRPVEGAPPGPRARGRGSPASSRYRRSAASSPSFVGPSPARAVARRHRGPRGGALPRRHAVIHLDRAPTLSPVPRVFLRLRHRERRPRLLAHARARGPASKTTTRPATTQSPRRPVASRGSPRRRR